MTRVHGGVALLAFGLLACGKPPEAKDECADVAWPVPSTCDKTAPIEARLRCIPGLVVTPVLDGGAPDGTQRFELWVEQQVDPKSPAAGTFEQRVTLDYVSDSAPTILFTTGYDLGDWPQELTTTYGANQLSYEHRFFSASTPQNPNWSTLNIENAAADAHHLAESLRWALPGKWINTGGSKGGMTSIFHRRFHPCDVDATVAYVAPITQEIKDPAYSTFIDNAGGSAWASCRADLIAFQRRLLTARDTLVPQVPGNFTYLGADKAFELAVVELPFAFWQYTAPDNPNYGCAKIPAAGASDEEMLQFLQVHSPPDYLAGDEWLDFYAAYYYQAASQLGAAAPYEMHISDLLRFPGADVAATFIPPGVPTPTFSSSSMADLAAWAKNDAHRVLLVYGEFDPWSTHPIQIDTANDSKSYTKAGGNHGSRLGTLSDEQRDDALKIISRWLGGRQVLHQPRRLGPPTPEHRFPR